MNRAAVFAHFDKHNIIDDYVIYYLTSLKEICNKIVFVTTSTLKQPEIQKIENICETIIIRDNIGYDFISYKEGLSKLSINDYDEIIACNDSVYGPLSSLKDIFNTMERHDCDYWGLTDSFDISYHIQSYFIVFRANALRSDIFKEFWLGVIPLQNKREIIENYEIGMNKAFISKGLRVGCFINAGIGYRALLELVLPARRIKQKRRLHDRHGINPKAFFIALLASIRHLRSLIKTLNKSHFMWKVLITKYNFPFIKVELLRDNPMGIRIADYDAVLHRMSSYDIKLITNHLTRMDRGHISER